MVIFTRSPFGLATRSNCMRDRFADDAVARIDIGFIFVVRRALVAEFQLCAEHAAIISEDRSDIVAHLVVYADEVILVGKLWIVGP